MSMTPGVFDTCTHSISWLLHAHALGAWSTMVLASLKDIKVKESVIDFTSAFIFNDQLYT